MIKRNKSFIALVLLNLIIGQRSLAQNFSTDGDLIRHAITAKVDGKNHLYIGELEGRISLYDLKGKKLWSVQTDSPAILFEIEASDIDGDGNDDVVAASGDGQIYCWNSKGKQLWKFNPGYMVRFSEVAIVKNDKRIQIFAGGNNFKLYELNKDGHLISETAIEGVVRKIQGGRFLDTNKESLYLITYAHDKFWWLFHGIIDADTKKPLVTLNVKDKKKAYFSKGMINDIHFDDIDQDGKDDILLFGSIGLKPFFTGLNGEMEIIAKYSGANNQSQRYAGSQGTYLSNSQEVVFQYGGFLLVLDNKGNLKQSSGKRYGGMVYSDLVYEPNSNRLIAAGEVDGGNSIYFFDLEESKWWDKKHSKQGRMLEVEKNLANLYDQVLDFELPDYQNRSSEEWVMITGENTDAKLNKLSGANVKFVIQTSPKESTDRAALVKNIGDGALKKDSRGKYEDSREDIIKMAYEFESKGQPFTFWAGHGNDPFYIQIETLEKVLEVAPTTCYGFVYAEMENVDDPRIKYFVEEYLPRLATAIRKNNKAKLYFRYKNMFWAATTHLPLWKDMFLSGKYSDFLIPASEDTSNRIQDLNLAGRVGMMAGGYVNDFAMRLIDDNPTSWRPLSPGGQNSVSPYLRQGVIMAAYGAKHGLVLTSDFVEDPGLTILFALMKSGVLPIVNKEDILSIGSWHLIQDIDEHLVESVDHHHNIELYKEDDDNAVFSVGQMHWAGSSIPKHDFSAAALGLKYRWLNYMPEMPFGMVPIAPIEYKTVLEKKNIDYNVSNGKIGFINDKPVDAKEFGTVIRETVETGSRKLPILVEGVSWSAVKIDEKHTRLILVDPGYINPKAQKATIRFQNRKALKATDILSKEDIAIHNNEMTLLVPAGSMRFIDITY